MEEKNKSISTSAEVALIDANFLNFIYKVLDKLHSGALVHVINAHYRVSPNIKMSVFQVLRHRLHQILQNTFKLDFADKSQCSTSNELVWTQKIFPERIARENEFFLQSAISICLLDNFPVEEQDFLNLMILKLLQIRQDWHDKPRVIVIGCYQFDQGFQVFFLLLESARSEHLRDVRWLRLFRDVGAWHDKVAILFLYFFLTLWHVIIFIIKKYKFSL